jgi:hypothetical protein
MITVKDLPHRAVHRLGFRGAMLACFATFDVIWGWSLVDPSSAQAIRSAPQYRVLFSVPGVTPFILGCVMLTAAVIIGVQAWMENDGIGFATAILIKVPWTIFVLAAWSTAGAASIRLAGIFIVLAAIVFVSSRQPDVLNIKE